LVSTNPSKPPKKKPINQPISQLAKMYIAMTKTTLFAAALAIASTASAHMIIEIPAPFLSPDVAPLLASGSNFPCQVGSGGSYIPNSTYKNEWTVGSEITLTFKNNTATHGGGSCQISVTKDKEPTPQSVWKVIHSIEGGCPTSDEANNGKLNTFPFTVPSELPEGRLTMAWTWFNKVGNREMYMNCAPIEVSGGSGEGFDSLPDMAVANIAVQDSCTNEPGFDYTFANAGKYVTKMGTTSYQGLCGGASSEGSSTGSSTGGSTGSGAPSEGGSTGGYGSNGGSSSPGGFNSGSSSGNSGAAVPPAPPIETPEQPNATTPKDSEDSIPKPPSTGGSSSGGASGDVASSGGSPCSENGAITCKGQDHFGICSNGLLVWQSVAAGTACNNGVIARRGYIHRHQRHSI
jgi:hypothetical protein